MVLEHAGFGVFNSALSRLANFTDRCVTRGVFEIFWDITSTFPFPFGEMTITPFEFAMLTDLGFTWEPLVY